MRPPLLRTGDGFIRRARDILRIRNAGPSTKIGCIELEDVEFFPKYLWVPLGDFRISDRIVSQYVPASVAHAIIARFGRPYEEVLTKTANPGWTYIANREEPDVPSH